VIIVSIFQIRGFYNFLYAFPLKKTIFIWKIAIKKNNFSYGHTKVTTLFHFSFFNYNNSYIFLKNNNINNILIVFNFHVIFGTGLNFHTKVTTIIFFYCVVLVPRFSFNVFNFHVIVGTEVKFC